MSQSRPAGGGPGSAGCSRRFREGFPRFHLAGAALGQVAQGDHSHHLARLQHREPAHLLHRHHPGGLRRVIIRGDHGTVPGHDVLDLDLVGVLLRGDAPGHDVPVGDDAPQAAVLAAHREGAQVVTAEEAGRQEADSAGVMETTL